MPLIIPSDNKKLLEFLERRHPDYAANLDHWNFLESTYFGGRKWFQEHIFQYLKEGSKEFRDRKERAYRFNHTREVVDQVQKYIFKARIERKDTAKDYVKRFWKRSTLSGLDINHLMRMVDRGASIFGRCYVVVDSNKRSDLATIADEKQGKVRVYAYTVKPQNALDMGFEDDGQLGWILFRETYRDDSDPFDADAQTSERFRLWTRDAWALFRIVEEGTKKDKKVQIVDAGEHGLGRVPVVWADQAITENLYNSPALINDIAYLDRAVANYLSNLDAIIQDQTFSQLAIPTQSLPNTADGLDQLIEMGTKRIFAYDGEGGAGPEYLSPDPKQAGVIISVINKIIAEIYHTVGMAGERTKQDNAVGIDNSSGVAKAYDFERVNSLLAAKADTLQKTENEIVQLVQAWHGEAVDQETFEEVVDYPDTFDVHSLFDEFTVAERLQKIEAPDTVRRSQMDLVIDKLFPQLADELRTQIQAELKSWPKDPVEEAIKEAKARTDMRPPPNRNPQTQKRQGQVTSATT